MSPSPRPLPPVFAPLMDWPMYKEAGIFPGSPVGLCHKPNSGPFCNSYFYHEIYKHEVCARDIAYKAARLSGMVMKLFCTHDPSFMTRLYSSYIRPVLEYAAPVWTPSGKGVIAQLERVERSCTKRIRGMRYLSYD